jgi:hypothetical protein
VICPPSRFALLDIMLDKLLDIKKKCLVTTRQMLCPASCTSFKPWVGKVEYARRGFDIRLWKWLCNHVLQLVQLRLTNCVTASYGLWKWLASSSPRLWKWLCNHVLQLVQLRLTNCVTASYGLWKWLASSSPIYGKGFRSGTSENQRLHKKLGNSENRVTYKFR